MKTKYLIVLNVIVLVLFTLYLILPIALLRATDNVIVYIGTTRVENYSFYSYVFALDFPFFPLYLIFVAMYFYPIAKIVMLERTLIKYHKGTVKENPSVIEDYYSVVIFTFLLVYIAWVLVYIAYYLLMYRYSFEIWFLPPFYLPFFILAVLIPSYFSVRIWEQSEIPSLTKTLRQEIKQEYLNGATQQEIADKYNLSMIHIHNILKADQ